MKWKGKLKMQKNRYKDKIISLLAEACQTDTQKIELMDEHESLTSTGLTSISFISFIVKLEEEFEIEINDSDLVFEKFETLDALYKTLSSYISLENTPEIKKCLILDCDNVLWKGIAGEEAILIDEDVLKLHLLLSELYKQGIFLCLCSKSKPEFIDDAFKNQDMKIDKSIFAVAKINRTDKTSNIKDIISELNIGKDSVVFVDDSDYELGYISLSIPEIYTIKADWSDISFIEEIKTRFSDTPHSDLNRTELYREQKEREKEKKLHITVDEYNASLKTITDCREAKEEDIPRVSELSVRTNQFNLSDAHFSEEEIKSFLGSRDSRIVILSASDKYGDMGIVGAAITRGNIIEAFMLSCRVFDRGFEYILLDKLKSMSSEPLKGKFRNNQKNAGFADFYSNNVIEVI